MKNITIVGLNYFQRIMMRIFTLCLFLFQLSVFALEETMAAQLSEDEVQYLQTKKVIKMCNNQNWEPIEFAHNDDQGQMSGIAIDILKLVATRLNVELQNVPTKDWSESQQFLKEKKCDILPAAVKTKTREKYANFTKPYLDYKIAIITKTTTHTVDNLSELNGKTMARKKGSALIEVMLEKNPTVNIIKTDDYLQSLIMVQNNEVDFTIAPVPEAAYYMSKFGLYDLHIAGYLDQTLKLSIAVRNDDTHLVAILDKALQSVKSSEMKQIHDDWTNIKFKELFWETKSAKGLGIFIFVMIVFFIYRNFVINKANKNLTIAVAEKTQELEKLNQALVEYGETLKDLNDNLEQKIAIEVDKVKKIENQLFQSEKMAAMGEMIGNIAHQWRQPLSLISTSATGILMQQAFNILDEESITTRMNDINNVAQFLSQTIDDFRDLVKGDLVLEKFNLLENINKCLVIEEAILRVNEVILVKDINETIEIISYQNLIIQSLMNIINNAKDILVEKNLDKKYIFLSTALDKNSVVITVKDNGGGIPEGVIEHIFEPYFTTKHKTQGTGLGLHMTYKMIVNELQGSIMVESRTYEFEDNFYNGAEFIIRLPLEVTKEKDDSEVENKEKIANVDKY